jgi:hypothetical protein
MEAHQAATQITAGRISGSRTPLFPDGLARQDKTARQDRLGDRAVAKIENHTSIQQRWDRVLNGSIGNYPRLRRHEDDRDSIY